MKRFKKIFKISCLLLILGFLVHQGVYFYAKMFLPKLEIKNANSFALFDQDKNLFFQGNGRDEWISLDEISTYVKDATLAIEDKNFYKHKGFDYLRIAKAGYTNITTRTTSQGASTITQQYARNLFLNFDKTWQRKWDEMWYTIELEAHYSKDELLEGYLNTINYGHANYGIENASKFYFNKSSSELNLAEASMLTGIPKSPSNFSPLVNEEAAKKRQLVILNAMMNNNLITEEEKEEAYNQPLEYIGQKNSDELSSRMYYKDAVLQELETLPGIPSSYIQTNGLKVYTNLDLNAQKNLEETINKIIPEDSELEVSVTMMNPNTGGIIALMGGKNYNKSEYNRAIDSKRQVGSTMKPLLYYAALENGFTSSTSFTSEETTFTFNQADAYSPKNYNNTYGHKAISMGTAIAYSENIYAVKTHMFLGESALIDISKRVGITANLEAIPSLPLGTKEISILEMSAAYSAFANEGSKVTPHFIKKVEDQNGNVLYERKDDKIQVLNKSLTFILNNLLTATYDKDYIDYNQPTALALAPKLTHKYAIKSGTTNTDNWYIGYNKDILTSVWVGYDDNRDLVQEEYKYVGNIWYQSIESYEKDKEDSWYDIPSNITAVLVDPITGKPVTESSPRKKVMYFIKGTEPTGAEVVFDERLETITPS